MCLAAKTISIILTEEGRPFKTHSLSHLPQSPASIHPSRLPSFSIPTRSSNTLSPPHPSPATPTPAPPGLFPPFHAVFPARAGHGSTLDHRQGIRPAPIAPRSDRFREGQKRDCVVSLSWLFRREKRGWGGYSRQSIPKLFRCEVDGEAEERGNVFFGDFRFG